jgi:asparagine synthetase B (glutamine-hydrolysing)
MLGHQWFFLYSSSNSSVNAASLPEARKKVAIDIAGKQWLLLHGLTTCVEETPQHYSIAVGDTRGLRELSEFQTAGPRRHAVILTIEKDSGIVRVLTDRINYSKIFCHKLPDGFVLATHLTFFSREDLHLSSAGLACGIANGTQFFTSTVFKEIEVLERACLHTFDGRHHHTEAYWMYGFGEVVPRRSAKDKMKECLVESVRAQVCDRPLLLSLSGGFDSSGILGILAKYVKPA